MLIGATKKRCESPLLFFIFPHRKADPVVHRLEVCFVSFFSLPASKAQKQPGVWSVECG